MRELSWAEKYRPRQYSDVLGQARAVKQLTQRTSSRTRHGHIILEGPSGSGKTTLARIFAKAMQCSAPHATGEAWGDCHACILFDADNQPSFHRINAGFHGTMRGIRELLDEDLVKRPFSAAVHVVFFDEADNLTEKAQRALLTPLEDGSRFVAYVFSLIDADQLIQPLRARCSRIELNPPTPTEGLQYLERIACAEGLNAESAALELIARLVSSYRELASVLENLSADAGDGMITPALARAEIRKGRTEQIVRFLFSALDGDMDGQLGAMAAARLSPKEKADAVLDLLAYLKLKFVGPLRTSREHRLDLMLEEPECRRIIGEFETRAERLDIDLPTLFDEVLEFWSFQPLRMDEAALQSHIVRFSDLLIMDRPFTGERSEVATRLASAKSTRAYQSTRGRRRPPRWRSGDRARAIDSAQYLSAGQAHELYEAATFLVQRYGVTFNACLTLDHRAWGVREDKEAVAVVSDLLRELSLRMGAWAGGAGETNLSELHRIALLERPSEETLQSTILLHLPGFAEDRARRWIFDRFLSHRFGVEQDSIKDWLEVTHRNDAHGALAHHWFLMRRLWRGVNPEIDAEGELLIDRLRVPRKDRRASGRINCRRFNLSHSLGRSVRAEEAELLGEHLSAFDDRAWEWLFTRWEWTVFQAREKARIRQAERMRAFEREREVTGDPLSMRKLAFEMRSGVSAGQKPEEFRQKPWERAPR